MRSLRRGPDRVAIAVRGGHDAAGLHGRRRHASEGEPTAYDDIRAGEGGRDIAGRLFVAEADVSLDVVVDATGEVSACLGVADGRQGFVVDLDRGQRIGSSGRIDGDDGRDGLAGEPDDVDRQRLVRRGSAVRQRAAEAALVEAEVLAGQHGDDSRRETAALMSRWVSRPCATGLRRKARCNVPAGRTFAVQVVRPVTRWSSSLRRMECPINSGSSASSARTANSSSAAHRCGEHLRAEAAGFEPAMGMNPNRISSAAP